MRRRRSPRAAPPLPPTIPGWLPVPGWGLGRRGWAGARCLPGLCLAALCLAGGCGAARPGAAPSGDPGDGAARAVEAYARAVREGDARGIHRLLDPETRATTSVAEIERLIEENRAELLEQARLLAERAAGGFRARARFTLSPTHRVDLVTDADTTGAGRTWHLAGGVFIAPSLDGPVDAILALRHALAIRSLAAVLRVLSRETRADLEAEIEDLMEETADPLGLEVTTSNGRAVVRTPSGRVLVLVEQAGEWRVAGIGDVPAEGPTSGAENEAEEPHVD